MTQVPSDPYLSEKLFDFTREVEICNDHGFVIARVVPVLSQGDFDPKFPPASKEELDRRSKSSERRYTTAEMLDYLEKR